jgi:3-oxoadipate enol-lactonase
LLAVATHSTGHKLSKIACPTVVVTGSHDLLVPPENAKRMARRIRRASLYVLPEVGHDVITLAPEAVRDSLRMLGHGAPL